MSNYQSSETIQKGPIRFRITQITNQIKNEDWSMVLRLERHALSQDWNFGIAPNIGLPQSTNANAIITQSGYISQVSLNNATGPAINVVSNGQPLTDQSFMPYIFNWDGSPLTIGITLDNIPSGASAYIWRWMYIAEDAYFNGGVITGNGNSVLSAAGGSPWVNVLTSDLYALSGSITLPYDVRANIDSPIARRFWWPLMRASSWKTNDGVTAYTTTTTLTDVWSGGPGTSGNWNSYGGLIVGKNDFFGDQTLGFVGQPLWASGTPGANALGASSTMKYGVDFGMLYTQSPIYYGIKRKQTPCYLNILVATTAGTAQFKKIAFMLSL